MGSIRRFARLLAEGEREALAGLGGRGVPDPPGESADGPDEKDASMYGSLSDMESVVDMS